MTNLHSDVERFWDVFLIGGASGTGKTHAAYALARHFGTGLAEVDDFHTVLEAMTTPEQQPELHYWNTNPDAHEMTAEDIVALHVSVARIMLPAFRAVITNHVEERTPVVLEGDYLLPELLTQDENAWQHGRVRGVFLYDSQEQIVNNFLEREPEEGEQTGRAHVSWLFGEWLREECARHKVPALAARPWNTLQKRILDAIS